MTTVSIFMPNLVQGTLAEASGYTMLLVKPSDKSLLNGAGDSLAWAGNGWLTAEIAEPWTETLSVTVVDGDGLVPFGGWLGVGSDVVADGVAELNSETLIRFVTEDTGETEAADGSVAKLAQGAGGTDWTEQQREYILEQLALLTVSGASVVVTSGVYMCARGDVEQVYGNANTATWADLNNNQNSSEITSRINYHIAIADNYIRSVLTQGAWVMPVEGDTIPAILAYNCARLAGVLLYEGRGVTDYDPKGRAIHQLSNHKNGVDSFLKSVVYGSTDLSPLVKSSTNEAPTAS